MRVVGRHEDPASTAVPRSGTAGPTRDRSRWFPSLAVVGVVAAGLLVEGTTHLLVRPGGHWSGHLTNAFLEVVVLGTVLTGAVLVVGRPGRPLPAPGGAALAVVLAGLVVQVVGNVAVAGSIWGTAYGDVAVERIGSGLPGFVAGHEVAGTGDTLVVAGGLALALVLGTARRVRPRVAVSGAVLSVVPPAWAVPACGVVFLLAHLLLAAPRSAAVPVPRGDDAGGRAPAGSGDLASG